MKKQRLRALAWPCAAIFLALAILAIVLLTRRHRHHQDQSSSQSNQPQAGGEAAAGSASWDEQVPNLRNYSSKDLARFVAPLVTMSNNAYGFSSPVSVSGWKLSSRIAPLAPSSQAGAQALVYEQDGGDPSSKLKKIVVAFRGTLSQADSCVDRLLFGELPGMSLPDASSCISTYGNESLDYVSQAVSYTRLVVDAYTRESTSLLLTGHSLGGALAVLVAASMAGNASSPASMAALGFCSPGSGGAMAARSIEVPADMTRKVLVIGDEWDTVVTALWAQQRGTVCLVQRPEPSDCAACSASSDGNSSNCGSCVFGAHSLTGILDKLQAGDSVACSDH